MRSDSMPMGHCNSVLPTMAAAMNQAICEDSKPISSAYTGPIA